jgi:2',3'-cyclic-nucleotide 2'-phosphodiesterase/3'-nucleotidase
MKRLFLPVLLVALLFAGCQTLPDLGSVDKARVELVDGKAKVVDILTFNDFHGTLVEEPKGKNLGIAKMASVIYDARKANPNTLLVAGGDLYQGSALSSLTKGAVVNTFFSQVGLLASAVGNHEFDWGSDNFTTWAKDGKFSFLAANIIDKKTGKPVAWAKPYETVLVGGHKISFIGLSTQETLSTVKAEHIAGYEFRDPAAVAAELVPKIKAVDKPELVIVISHVPSAPGKEAGSVLAMPSLNELESLSKVAGIDAIVTGHSHNTVAGTINGVPVVQGYYNGRSFGKLALNFEADGSFKIVPSVIEAYKTKDTIAEDAGAKQVFDDYNVKYGTGLQEKVATVQGDLNHAPNANVTPMGKWVCDMLRAHYGLQVYIQNGGGLRKGFAAGEAKISDFWELMPFDNYTVTFKTSGMALKEMIAHGLDSKDFRNGQFSGVKVKYDPAATGTAKILEIALEDGTSVTDDGMYTVGTNDFQFSGGDKYAMIKPNAKEIKETFEPVRDILIAEARKAGIIVAPPVAGIVTK